jgi:hypothetical protein
MVFASETLDLWHVGDKRVETAIRTIHVAITAVTCTTRLALIARSIYMSGDSVIWRCKHWISSGYVTRGTRVTVLCAKQLTDSHVRCCQLKNLMAFRVLHGPFVYWLGSLEENYVALSRSPEWNIFFISCFFRKLPTLHPLSFIDVKLYKCAQSYLWLETVWLKLIEQKKSRLFWIYSHVFLYIERKKFESTNMWLL